MTLVTFYFDNIQSLPVITIQYYFLTVNPKKQMSVFSAHIAVPTGAIKHYAPGMIQNGVNGKHFPANGTILTNRMGLLHYFPSDTPILATPQA